MKVLMISYDHTMLIERADRPGDTRERHIKYAQALRARYPDGSLTVILKVPVSWSSAPQQLAEGLWVYPLPCRRHEFPFKAFQLGRRILRQERYHLVTTETPFDDGLVGLLLKRHFGIPLNIQMRSSFLDVPYWVRERLVNKIFNLLGKYVSRMADTIRVVSKGEKERLERHFPWIKGRIFFLPPLVNFAIFNPPATSEEKDRAWMYLKRYIARPGPVLLFVGRLSPEKNIATLLKSFALLLGDISDAVLVLIGNGKEAGRLQTLGQRLGIKDRLLWLGNQALPALRGWYSIATATILPSLYEGFGKVIVESYLMETPVIATPFVSAPELIKDRETGYIISDFFDYADLATKMRALITDSDMAKRMGRAGKYYLIHDYLISEDEYMYRLLAIWEETSNRSVKRACGSLVEPGC